MTFSYTTTAFPQRSSIVRGNVGLVGGHYILTNSTTAHTISTGGTHVMMAFSQSSSTIQVVPADGTVQPSGISLNMDGAGALSYGDIRLVPGFGTDDGHWMAFVATSGSVDPTES